MINENVLLKFSKEENKIVTLAALGGMLEFYDFIIYGIFSVYFAPQFFPSNNALLSVIQSYVVFILGYIARPIGGILFSHLGDEYGRKKALILTILLMGISSLGIGLLPTYSQIGLLAPISLLFLRLLQGVALGGELPSTYVYISESIPKKHGSAFGITMTGVNSGLLLGMLINLILNQTFTQADLNAYGWRLPFIFGGALCMISYLIRKTLHETTDFKKVHTKPEFPLLILFKNYLPQLIMGILMTSIMSGLVVVAIIFMPTYLHEMLQIDNKIISHNMLIVMLLNVITIFFTGKIVDRVKPQTILWTLLALSALLVPCSYFLISFEYSLRAALIILGILEGIAAMIIPLLITYLFPVQIRLTGVALCYNLSFTLFGGVAPVAISALIKSGHNIYLTPMFYLMFIVLISGIGLLIANRKKVFVTAIPGEY